MLAVVLLAGAMASASGAALLSARSPIIFKTRHENTTRFAKEVSDGSVKELPDQPKPKLEPDSKPDKENSLSGTEARSPKSPVRSHETWIQAMSHRDTLAIAIGLVVSDVLDVEATQSCLKGQICYESNPIFFSKHPSRRRMYSISLSLTAVGIYGMGRMKQKGRIYGLIAELLGGAQIASHLQWAFTKN